MRLTSGLKTGLALTAILMASTAQVAAEDRTAPIRIGVLTDMTGLYNQVVGEGSVIAVNMAIEDFGGKVRGLPIEVLSADTQNKVDVTTGVAREWIETQGVDLFIDVPISSGTLAVNKMVKDHDRLLFSNAGTGDLGGRECNGHSVQWNWDNYSMAAALTNALLAEGSKNWFYLTADYTFGHDLEGISANIVKESGGTVVKAIRMPLGAADQSAAALEVGGSDADVIGLANGGTDTQNSIKQLAEFGVSEASGKKIAAFVLSQNDIDGAGLDLAGGLYVPMPFYWDMNEATREWSKRFMERSGGRPPSYQQAGVYSSVTHYLKSLENASSSDGADVIATMRATPIDDKVLGKGELRADGRTTFPMYLFQVKTPEESTARWDYLKLIREVPAEQVLRAPGTSECSLLTSN
ncbi:ABC transporter substrate-binding protein [Aquamicrobium sp. LC103]|uniref:ABC transporter substrate-binding protein n=1 Tax=Aquamicrobium sp. LC103 TaxID=1120658 RepID=UPI00063EA9BD|nr:ABC transporter substrate-binding protein [Aquamicrobium sp. LC103]TKT69792.1 ABC transporter substrate-binding protein [Aquamicrobium sp. LC103]